MGVVQRLERCAGSSCMIRITVEVVPTGAAGPTKMHRRATCSGSSRYRKLLDDRVLTRDLEANPRTVRRDVEYIRRTLRAPIAFDPVRRGARDYLSGDFILDLDPGVGDAWKERPRHRGRRLSAAPVEPTRAGHKEILACLRRIDGGPLAWGGDGVVAVRTRPMPGPDQPLCPSGMPGDLTRGVPGSRSARWQTNQILSPVLLPYSWYWKHVAVMITGLDFKAITIPPPSVHIAVALG